MYHSHNIYSFIQLSNAVVLVLPSFNGWLSSYRHHHNGRWEARIGRIYGNKYLYLGTFSKTNLFAVNPFWLLINYLISF